MPTAEIDIEAIVREVVRRLRQVNGELADGDANCEALSTEQSELKLEDRLVTLETLHNRLAGVRSVSVPHRAIVTPAVRDELKDRGIALSRSGADANVQTNGNAKGCEKRPTVWVMVDGIDVAALQRMCGSAIAVKSAGDLGSVVRSLSQVAAGVVITHAPSAAVVTANRNANVRAAVGFNFPAVRQAVDEANANLLAIDPRGKGTAELFGLINEFLSRK